jgi:hypothetical protein
MTILTAVSATTNTDGIELAILSTLVVLLSIKVLTNRAKDSGLQAMSNYVNIGIVPLVIVSLVVIFKQLILVASLN